jgi:hypothetical protein
MGSVFGFGESSSLKLMSCAEQALGGGLWTDVQSSYSEIEISL